PAEDMIAVLSNSDQLRILQIDTGQELTHLTVTPSPQSRELHLRPYRNRLVVLPEAVTDSDAQNDYLPVSDGVHVYGHAYGIDRSTMSLSWQQPLGHCFIRTLTPDLAPILPNVPLLVLVTRYQLEPEGGLPFGPSRHGARVIDVETGEDLFHPNDPVGVTLNDHWLQPDPEARKVYVSFERQIVTFDYNPPVPAEKQP
ncbi:MAG: hypothetical protein KDA85_17240, partial [Planctomycetaceae bacterium]|nr:hypothetical protein [Planctomycetaceae bacterium]